MSIKMEICLELNMKQQLERFKARAYLFDGHVRVWCDRNVVDYDKAKTRYIHPFYRNNQYSHTLEENLCMSGGI